MPIKIKLSLTNKGNYILEAQLDDKNSRFSSHPDFEGLLSKILELDNRANNADRISPTEYSPCDPRYSKRWDVSFSGLTKKQREIIGRTAVLHNRYVDLYSKTKT